jgi:hypothetical protein
LGIGGGLLLANTFTSRKKRAAVGWTLVAAGAFMGAGLAYESFGQPRPFTLAFGNRGNGGEAQAGPQELPRAHEFAQI